MKISKNLLQIYLFCRLANPRWREWGPRVGVDAERLESPYCRFPRRELIRIWSSANGISEVDAPLEMARGLGLKLSPEQRLLFSKKANCVRLGAVPSTQECDIPSCPLEPLGFQLGAFYRYATPDGKSVSGGVGYLNDAEGNTIRLPATPWNDESPRVHWDWLSWGTPLPLYRSHELCALPERIVFILPSEQDVENLVRDAAGLVEGFPLTTWPGGLQETLRDADWGMLASRRVAIVLHPSVEGVRIADTLLGQLEKAGVQQVGFVLAEAQIKVAGDWGKRIALSYDIAHALLRDRTASRDGFWAFSKREFGLELGPKDQHALPPAEFLSLPVPEATWSFPNSFGQGIE